MKPTVCLDFDGVLSRYDGWNGRAVEPGPPLPGAVERCRELDRDFRLVVLTARDDLEVVRRWLDRWGFPRMEVTNDKVPALAYLDDRAIRFGGDWSKITAETLRQRTWWEVGE